MLYSKEWLLLHLAQFVPPKGLEIEYPGMEKQSAPGSLDAEPDRQEAATGNGCESHEQTLSYV